MELRSTMIAAVALAAVVLVAVTMFPARPAQQVTVKIDRAPTSARKADDHVVVDVKKRERTPELRRNAGLNSNCVPCVAAWWREQKKYEKWEPLRY